MSASLGAANPIFTVEDVVEELLDLKGYRKLKTHCSICGDWLYSFKPKDKPRVHLCFTCSKIIKEFHNA